MNDLYRVGALISGGGRTVLNLAEQAAAGKLPIQIALVIAHSEEVSGVERCRALGLPVVTIPKKPIESMSDRIDEALESAGVQLVCLCGYLQYFRVGTRWAGKTLNIHPSLLPDFGGQGMYGEHVHRAVLDAGRTQSGCTVHMVDEEYDHGPVVLQRRCPVHPSDTPETLAARVFELECEAFPAALREVLAGSCEQEEKTIP